MIQQQLCLSIFWQHQPYTYFRNTLFFLVWRVKIRRSFFRITHCSLSLLFAAVCEDPNCVQVINSQLPVAIVLSLHLNPVRTEPKMASVYFELKCVDQPYLWTEHAKQVLPSFKRLHKACQAIFMLQFKTAQLLPYRAVLVIKSWKQWIINQRPTNISWTLHNLCQLEQITAKMNNRLSTKTECDYLNGWIKKRSHTQKSHPKVVNPTDIAGERKKKTHKKTRLF